MIESNLSFHRIESMDEEELSKLIGSQYRTREVKYGLPNYEKLSKELLEEEVKQKHNTQGKAICYV